MESSQGINGKSDNGIRRGISDKSGDKRISGEKIELDEWQRDILETEGNIALRSGRQVGKSTIISIKGAEYALRNPKSSIMIISATERQAFLLFSKVLAYIYDNYKSHMKKGKDRPTKSEIKLINGSIIRCLPTGLDGIGIRGFTVNLLIADEAHFIPEDVWQAVTPMLSATKGIQVLLSTPHGREGYFYRCFKDSNFRIFHISSEDCPRIDKEFLKREKERMSKLQYTQEYLGEFIDELKQLFPDELIKSCMVMKRRGGILQQGNYFLGIDVARMGGDESTFEIIEKSGSKILYQIENIVTKDTKLTESIELIKELNRKYDFRKIYIDDGGLGVGIFDHLLDFDETKRKIVAINNARRSLDRDELHKKRLMKEDLYANLLRLMERGEIKLLDDPEIFLSLKSVQYEYDEKRMKIFGNYTHITEGLIRAAWCVKDKSLNIWVSSF